tara:strand:+ start:2443 stop:3150 length:708 start_codon:yes stop_codon:yes gene_type:complete
MIYIFDVDGTLTPSRNPMDKDFKDFFKKFIKKKRVWLISGSDKDKTIEQVGEDIWTSVERAYQSSGNQLWVKGELKYQYEFKTEDYLKELLEMFLDKSEYPYRYGNHIEERPGALNFSVVGRDCTQEQREHYAKWDDKHQERKDFAWEIKERYPWLDAVVGGEISIDIYEKFKDKGQIVKDIRGKFEFFGDRLYPGGNDFAIQQEIVIQKRKGCKTHPVKTWRDTEELLHSTICC